MLGRNGMGKTTIIRSIMGLDPAARRRPSASRVSPSTGWSPTASPRKGIGVVPQGRGIFPSLSVKENLKIAARDNRREGAWNLDRVYEQFPILKERASFHGNLLSGGEQQMLAVARALMANPELLIMDEPSEGLAPWWSSRSAQIICELKGKLTVFLAEQNFNMALNAADYVYVISKGAVVWEGVPEDLRNNEEVKRRMARRLASYEAGGDAGARSGHAAHVGAQPFEQEL